MTTGIEPAGRCVAFIGDRAVIDRSLGEAGAGLLARTVMLAADDASTAEIAAVQVPRLADLRPAWVVVHLNGRDLLDGYDESYFHARVVEICELIGQVASDADVATVAIPPFPAASQALSGLWQECNAAAEFTARLRGFRWTQLDTSAIGS